MNKTIIVTIALTLSAMACPLFAQKAKNQVRKVVVAKPKVDPKVAALSQKMLEAVQKVVVFDSVVVDKDSFLRAYSLDPDVATIADYDSFFSTSGHSDSYVCANGLKTRSFLAMVDSVGRTTLSRSDYFDNQWSEPSPVSGIDTNVAYSQANYPYMMTDGQTFYFAAKGSESLGGYDIFVTRYDADSKAFLQPENLGMPFNSTANDYMLVIDDINQIGWFASDRHQPKGKVCVYMFVPSTVRENYDSSELDDEQLKSLADLRPISATWKQSPQVREDALARMSAVNARLEQSRGSSRDGEMYLVVNDNNVYRNTKQFVVNQNVQRYYELTAMKANKSKSDKRLEELRRQFSSSPSRDLQSSIIAAERECEQLGKSIADQEKLIVNTENKALKNN